MKRILITGSEGFIGKRLADFLESKDCLISRFDLVNDGPDFPKVSQYDVVIHLGANSSTTEKNLKKILKQNFEFSKRLFELCASKGIKFQYASSASVYGNSETFNEIDFCKPLSPYALSKYMFDCWLLNQTYPYQGFRYFNVYGLGENKKGDQASPVYKFIKQAQIKKEIVLFEKSENYIRDFVCIDDICEIHLKMINFDQSGVFNIGTGKPISFRDVANIVQDHIPCDIKEIPMPQIFEGQYQKFSKANNDKLINIIGEFKWKTVNLYVKENLSKLMEL